MLSRQDRPDATTDAAQKKFTWNERTEEEFQRIKKESWDASVLEMPTKNLRVRHR